jgi:cation:H+ antiporter
MALNLFLIFVGFVGLVWSADLFLSGAASTATNFGIPKLVIGLTVVSLGTSAPEIVVAIIASQEGSNLLAVGNAIGSNIANIGLVLGLTAILIPVTIDSNARNKQLPWLLGLTVLALILLANGSALTFNDGIILLFGLVLVIYQIWNDLKREDETYVKKIVAGDQSLKTQLDSEIAELATLSKRKGLLFTFLGLGLLLISAELLVYAAINVAVLLGISELIIGLTVVAIGTSLPELAATIGAAIKKQEDIAVGNIIGSNILNITAVLCIPALLGGASIEPSQLIRDGGTMLALTILLALFAYGFGKKSEVTRLEGSILLVGWVIYTAYLISNA